MNLTLLRVLFWITAFWSFGTFTTTTTSEWAPYLAYPLWFLAWPISIFVHEAGHALGARLMGWRVLVFSVGWFNWHVHNRQALVTRRATMEDAGGWVLAAPWSRERFTVRRYAIMIAGGPVASLVQATSGLAIAVKLASAAPFHGIHFDRITGGFAIQGIAIFLATAVPGGKSSSDGARLLGLWRRRRERWPLDPLNWLASMFRWKIRLRDRPDWWLPALLEAHSEQVEMKQLALSLNIGELLDRMNVVPSDVRAMLDDYRDISPESDWANACDAYMAAIYEHDLGTAGALVARIAQPSEAKEMEAAARAALGMLRGNQVEADFWLDRMDKLVAEKSPFRDLTFRDIRKQIEAIVPLAPCEGGATAPLEAQ